MWVRVVIDGQMLVQEVLAVSDATPYRICTMAGAAAFQTLVEARRQYPEPCDAAGVPRRIDSCYAFAREREVVARAWPAYSLVAKDRSSGETSPAHTNRK